MVKVNKLALSIGAALVMGAVGSTQAATTTTHTQKKVVELESQVAQLQQLVLQLSAQQQQQVAQQQQIAQQQQEQSVQLQQNAILALEKPNLAPKESSSKPGWMTLADGKTQLKISGRVRTDVIYGLQGTSTDVYNKSQNTRLTGDKNNVLHNSLNTSIAGSRLAFDLLRPTSYGDLKAKIEADFMSNLSGTGDYNASSSKANFRVRQAYVSLGNWLVGQTASTFATDAPTTVDANGLLGAGTGQRPVQVRYTQPITKNQKVLVALEGTLGADVETSLNQTKGGSRLPTLALQYAATTADKKGALQAVGFLHENRVGTTSSNDIEKLAWGVGIGGKYNLTSNDTLFANYYHIVGDNKYMINPNSDAYSVSTNASKTAPVAINQTEYDAVFAGYTHKWNNEFKSSLLGGAIFNKKDTAYTKANMTKDTYNKSLYNVVVNTFYTPVKDFDLGAEYTYGQRKTFTNKEGDYSRINFVAQYNF